MCYLFLGTLTAFFKVLVKRSICLEPCLTKSTYEATHYPRLLSKMQTISASANECYGRGKIPKPTDLHAKIDRLILESLP